MAGTVHLVTEIPGPRSRAVIARRAEAVPRGVGNVAPVVAAATRGATLTDVDGNVLLDFAGGIGVLNVGSNHPEVVAAIQEQAGQMLHTCFHVAMYEGYVQLAEALNGLTPGNFKKKTLLVNTGAEAVENAVKLARRFTGRPAVVTFTNAFHGRTLLAMSLTAKVATYKYGFGPFAPEVYRLPAPYPYRSESGSPAESSRAALAEVERALEVEIAPDKVACMLIEPVQGESGFLVQPPEFLRGLRALCDRHGILLIADEIQTGFCRTGPFYALEHFGIAADLVCTAKSLGNGLPIAAVTGRTEIMDSAQEGGLGGTYGGNPVACAGALKVIEVMRRDNYPERAARIGRQVMERFAQLQRTYRLVGDARGLGAMCALELVRDRVTKEPATQETAAIFKACLERGLLLMKAGNANNVIRFLAPLAIADEQLNEGLDILEAGIAGVSPREV